jgi:hypothetical protein
MKSPKMQLSVANKANMEAALKLGLLSLEHTERLAELNLHNAKIALEHGIVGATAFGGVKDLPGLIALRTELAESGLHERAAYSRGVYRVAMDATSDFSALAEVVWITLAQSFAAWLGTVTETNRPPRMA